MVTAAMHQTSLYPAKRLKTHDGLMEEVVALRIVYLGEEVCQRLLEGAHCSVSCELIEGRKYTVGFLDRRGKVLKGGNIAAAAEIRMRQT